jgi:hypothetical protein
MQGSARESGASLLRNPLDEADSEVREVIGEFMLLFEANLF